MSTIRSFIWLLLIAQVMAYKISVDIHEFTDCPGYKSMIDFSSMEFTISEEGNIVFNGNLTVLNTIDSPYPLYIHPKKLERGEWRETIGFKFVKNFCQTLNTVAEFWYPVMKYLKKQSCPLEVGYVGKFDNFKYGELPMILPQNSIGEWMIFVERRNAQNTNEVMECVMLRTTVFEM